MMKNKRIVTLFLAAVLALSGCSQPRGPAENVGNEAESKEQGQKPADKPVDTSGNASEESGTVADSVVEANRLEDLYAGYSENAPADFSKVTVTCLSGSAGCYTMEGNTLTFTKVSEDSVYTIAGEFKGNIVIDVGDDYKFDLEMHGLSISNDTTNPITVLSGDKVTLTAKKDYQNYIYDLRTAVDENDTLAKSGAVYSEVDLKIAGKGALVIVSENNNGIHTKKDLEVKNINLTLRCVDNALKGNDSVSLENATTILIATAGDGIKTTNSDISKK